MKQHQIRNCHRVRIWYIVHQIVTKMMCAIDMDAGTEKIYMFYLKTNNFYGSVIVRVMYLCSFKMNFMLLISGEFRNYPTTMPIPSFSQGKKAHITLQTINYFKHIAITKPFSFPPFLDGPPTRWLCHHNHINNRELRSIELVLRPWWITTITFYYVSCATITSKPITSIYIYTKTPFAAYPCDNIS